MIYINEGNSGLNGLGKPKWMRKIRLRSISIKNAVKVVKFAAPIAVGFIPAGGGFASKLLNSKVGRVVSKVSKSKIAKGAIKLSKTQAGKLVVNQAKNIARPKIEAIQAMEGATFAKTETQAPEASTPYSSEDSGENAEPMGELTPVKQTLRFANTQQNIKVDDADVKNSAKKDNTILYVGGAVALAGFAFFATKKSK